jgi:AhpC/TSA family
MRVSLSFLFSILLLVCQTAFSQTVNSSIQVKIERSSYIVSGVVTSEEIKRQVIEKFQTQIGANANFDKIKVEQTAAPFLLDWETEFDKSLTKIKSWKSGIFIFGNNWTFKGESYPSLPPEIAEARITLTDGQTVSPKNYQNKVVVLFLNASWNSPGIPVATQLNEIYRAAASRNIEIIMIEADDDSAEKTYFPQFAKKLGIQYKVGYIDMNLIPSFVKITKLNGIPQTLIILNGKIRGVFAGGGPRIIHRLKETILKTLDENNSAK